MMSNIDGDGPAQAMLSKTHFADARRLKTLRTRQGAAVHAIRTASAGAKRPRVGEVEVEARLARDLSSKAIGLEGPPLEAPPLSAARQVASHEAATVDPDGGEVAAKQCAPLTPRPATLAQSATRQLEDFRKALASTS